MRMAAAANAAKIKRVFIKRINLVFCCKNQQLNALYQRFSDAMYGVETGCMRASCGPHFVLYFLISYNAVSQLKRIR